MDQHAQLDKTADEGGRADEVERNQQAESSMTAGLLGNVLDPVHHPGQHHQTEALTGTSTPVHPDDPRYDATSPSRSHTTTPAALTATSTTAADNTTSHSVPAAASTTDLAHKSSFRRLATAGLNKPMKLAGSIKRGLTRTNTANKAATLTTTATTTDGNNSSTTGNLSETEPTSYLTSSTSAVNLVPPKNHHAHFGQDDEFGPTTTTRAGHTAPPAHDPTQFAQILKPREHEEPIALLRVRIIGATSLTPKDSNGLADPHIALCLPPSPAKQTTTIKKTLNPSWDTEAEREKATFDFPLYVSLSEQGGGLYAGRGLELVVWDRDFGGLKQDYMGEVNITIPDWCQGGGYSWKETLTPTAHPLHSSRNKKAKDLEVSGSVNLQVGLLPLPGVVPSGLTEEWAEEVVSKLMKGPETRDSEQRMIKESLLAVPAYEGVGTVVMKPKKDKHGKRKSTVRSAARSVRSTLFRRKHKQDIEEAASPHEDTDAHSSGDNILPGHLADEDDDLDEEGSDPSDDESDDQELRDDGLSETMSERGFTDLEPEHPHGGGDVYSMGFLVPDPNRKRRTTTSTGTAESLTDSNKRSSWGALLNRTVSGSANGLSGGSGAEDQAASPLAVIKTPPTPLEQQFDPLSSVPPPTPGTVARQRKSKDALLAVRNESVANNSGGAIPTPSSGLVTPSADPLAVSVDTKEGRRGLRKKLGKVKNKKTSRKVSQEYNFSGGDGILGIVMVEVSGAKDLPRLRNCE